MPHLKSAAKRHRQSLKRKARNRHVRSDLRTQIKKFLLAVKENRIDDAKTEIKLCYKKLDKAATRGYLHKNTAYRYKSRLTRRLNAAEKPATPAGTS